jgi:hypothetical protein
MRTRFILSMTTAALTVLAAAGCGGKAPGMAVLDESADFSGTYQVEGPDCAGTVTITRAGKGYHLEWLLDDSTRYYGKGLVVEGVLGVAFSMQSGTKVHVMAYKKSGDGLSGLCTTVGTDRLSTEKTAGAKTLVPVKCDLTGHYHVKGVNQDGQRMSGKLDLEHSGQVWQATWDMGGEFSGTGMVIDSVAVFGFTDHGYGIGLTVYAIGQDRLDGIWTFCDYDQLLCRNKPVSVGTESATK